MLELEVIALRHQLAVLRRQHPGRSRLFHTAVTDGLLATIPVQDNCAFPTCQRSFVTLLAPFGLIKFPTASL